MASRSGQFYTVVSCVTVSIGHEELTEFFLDLLFSVEVCNLFLTNRGSAFDANSFSEFRTRRGSNDLAVSVISVASTQDHTMRWNTSQLLGLEVSEN